MSTFKKAGQISFAVFVILLILDMLFGSFPLTTWGQPPVVQPGQIGYGSIGTALVQIKYCVMGKPSSMILQQGTKLAFLRPYTQGGWSVVMADTAKAINADTFAQELTKTILMSPEDSADFVTQMTNKGWNIISKEQLPPSFSQAVMSTTIMSILPRSGLLALSLISVEAIDPCKQLPMICGGIDG